MKEVSVIVPCYNYGRYLRACIESILNQAGVDVTVLIIDDSSTDDTSEVCVRLAAADERVTFRRHEANRGHIRTYNEGFDWSSGDYTVLLSADDLLVPGSLLRATSLMDRHPDVGFVYGATVFIRDGKTPRAARTNARGEKIWSGGAWIEKRCRSTNNCISSPEVVMRTSLVKQLGGFSPELPHSGDLEYWMRCAAHGRVGYITGADQAYYRIHGASMMRQVYSAPLVDLQQRRAAFDLLFSEQGAFIPDRERLHRVAYRALSRDALWRACRAYDRGRVETTPVADLVEFAKATHPKPSVLSEFGLRWRQRLGPRVCPKLQLFLAVPVLRNLYYKLVWQSVTRRGV